MRIYVVARTSNGAQLTVWGCKQASTRRTHRAAGQRRGMVVEEVMSALSAGRNGSSHVFCSVR